MRVISLTGATAVTDPESGVEYEVGDGGVFDLPEPFGMHLTTKHASVWRAESQYEAEAEAARVEQMRNPHVVPGVLAKHEARLEGHDGRIADLEAKVEALLADQADSDTGTSDDESTDDSDSDATDEGAQGDGAEKIEAEAKPARTHKAPAKKAAAKPASE